jgi:hypothetical protein
VSISKTGYSSTQTYNVSVTNPNPNPGHLTVAETQTTSSSFAIDILGSITIKTFEVGTTTPLQNIPFLIRGDKTVGTDSEDLPIYKYSSSANTGSLGSVIINNLEWDNYTISINDTAVGYDVASICAPQPFSLSPSENETINIYLDDNVTNSLLVDVKDGNGLVLGNASVRLYRGGYDTTVFTDSCGQSFFNNSLSSGTVGDGNPYSASISLSGYTTKNLSNVEVNGASVLSVILSSL